MSKLLEGKVALVTGGSRGIGRGICEVFAREGCDIALNYHTNDAAAEETAAVIRAHGRRVVTYRASVANRPAMKQVVQAALADFERIDILINNAAVNRPDLFLTMSDKAWDEVMGVNLHGLFNVTKPVFKHMVRRRYGRILNIGSIGGIRTVPTSVHYATAKAAVVGFTKMLAREGAAFGVLVNAIAAGIFDTDLGHTLPERFREIYEMWCSVGRLGKPQELGELAAFLVSDRNAYMNGEVIILDGGTVT
ncbi:MAG: SDR family NAD(P)-dependent oxidoreductase [Chloracidobacterium sp.]|uniref:SDR family oxidoreductase n=1 Tax=Chloracidobacterium validum TaxID=2821543 RepID=A0ABX8BC10_9BACT|nr:SDR family NAD(P)-dependent oxidoreductase [Chloracidobacterium validum]QUW04464.1 SDR family oxidoreductase [Chloracidobacterium validum]